MARAVFFNRLGKLRDRTLENQRHRASGLNLVVAAIVLWNTVYLERAVQALRTRGKMIPEAFLTNRPGPQLLFSLRCGRDRISLRGAAGGLAPGSDRRLIGRVFVDNRSGSVSGNDGGRCADADEKAAVMRKIAIVDEPFRC